MDKWFIGYDEDCVAELFMASNPEEADPQWSGYNSVDGPFDTKEEAEANMV